MHRLTRYHALTLMVLCLLIAAVLRLPDLPSFPSGVHYDEAANGVLSGDIGLRGERPIFITSYTGKETLFFYLAGGVMRFVGESVFSLRLTAAYIGLLTVAATYWMGREMLADRRIALLAAALLAVSFWHLLFSRLGFRAISQPLLQALAVAALFRGLRGGRWPWFAAAGALIGLTIYTYLAARLFPALLLIAAIPLLIDRQTYRERWQQLLFTAAVAFLVVMPLLGFFLEQPDAFWTRIIQVAPGDATGLTLTQSFGRSLGMLFLTGDPYLRFNIPQRPLFNILWGALLVVGWILCVLRLRRFPYDWQRSALLLLAAAPVVMLLPTALAVNEIVPSNLRAIGLIPFIFYLPAIGLITLLRDVERRFSRASLTYAVQVSVLLILLGGGVWTSFHYFQDWGQAPELAEITDGDLTAAAAWLDETIRTADPDDTPTVFVAASHYRHPTLAFLSDTYDDLKWLPQSQALVLPAAGPALVLYPANSPLPDWAAPYLTAVDQESSFDVYSLEAGTVVNPRQPVAANFDNTITLLGVDTGAAVGGDTLPVTLYWQVEMTLPPESPLAPSPFVHLEDEAGHRWSQVESDAYPAEQWMAGDIIIQRVDLPLPAGMPGGRYPLRVGLFDPATGSRLAVLDEDGRFAGDSLIATTAPVQAGDVPDPLPQPPVAIGEQVLEGLQLLGYERGGPTAETGQTTGLALWWLAKDTPPPLALRIGLVGEDGRENVVVEGQPVHDTYPFLAWPASHFLIDRQSFRIPDDLAGGAYRYRLTLLDKTGGTVYTTDLGRLAIEKIERHFTPPPMAHETKARFGEEITLLGYDLDPAGATSNLTLVWQAGAQPTADYTVFVHLLNPDGSCCAWQQDAMPRQGAYPTTRWQPGEVVVDNVTIEWPDGAPAGEYPLEIGLYLAENGRRLPVRVDGGDATDALLLRPLERE